MTIHRDRIGVSQLRAEVEEDSVETSSLGFSKTEWASCSGVDFGLPRDVRKARVRTFLAVAASNISLAHVSRAPSGNSLVVGQR